MSSFFLFYDCHYFYILTLLVQEISLLVFLLNFYVFLLVFCKFSSYFNACWMSTGVSPFFFLAFYIILSFVIPFTVFFSHLSCFIINCFILKCWHISPPDYIPPCVVPPLFNCIIVFLMFPLIFSSI